MSCGNCGRELPPDSSFCLGCGAPQSHSCVRCGHVLPPDAVFCNRCGAPVAGAPTTPSSAAGAESERRLTSVLFADLVSYTTFSEARDTDEVRELLTAYFDVCSTVVRRYGGTVEKFIGDAVMAVWGVPTAHEDDAERAVRAGLELVLEVVALGERLGVPELALRVGIVSGEVTATLGAVDQGMVAGDPVNTAARIQALASGGEVWVDATTRSLTSASVTYVDVGEHVLKGKTQPARLYRAGAVVAGVGGLQRVDGLEAPLVGRDRDLRLLRELFHATEEAARPHLVVIDGEGGIGKSRLAWELEKYVDGLSRTVRWHRGRCLSYGDGVAFWALSEAVRGRLGLVGDETGAAVETALDGLLEEQVDDEAERAWLRPRVASLLGEESRDFAREDLFAAWTRFFERVAGDDPLVLVIDDAQHMDDGLAEFLDFLLTRGAFGCFVVLLARPELLAQRPHLGGRRATPVRLEPLRDADMGRLVDGLVDGLPGDLRAALVERAGGIPLYAVETVRALIDRDLVVPREGRYVVASGGDLDLGSLGPPATLHALVAARLDALEASERRVLSDASVLGEAFTREGVGILAEDVADLDRVLESLIRKELVAVEADRFSAERGQFRFVQTVVRQVAYGTLSRRDRLARHLAVAHHLERDTDRVEELAQVIAQHLLDAADASAPGDTEVADLRTRAGDLLFRAGERAAGLGAYADATRTYASALACLESPPLRALVLRRRARALSRQGRLEEALPDAKASTDLLDELGDLVGAAESAAEVTDTLHGLDRTEEAMTLALERLASLEEVTGHERPVVDRVRGLLLTRVAGGYLFTGRSTQAEAPLLEALRITNRVDEPEIYLFASNTLAIYQSRHGSQRIARTLLRGMADFAREVERWESLVVALINLGVHHAQVDLDEAIRITLEAVTVADDHGLVVDDTMHTNLLNYGLAAGRWDVVRETVDVVVSSPVPMRLAAYVAAGVLAQLRWSGAEVATELGLPDHDYEGVHPGVQAFATGSVALADGDTERALEQLASAVREELEHVGVFDDFPLMWAVSAWAALAEGRIPDSTPEMVGRALDEAGPSTSPVAHALVFRAVLAARGVWADEIEVESDLREGIELLDRCKVRVWAAHAREELGRWLVSQGREEEGDRELATAAAVYESLGATAWLDRVRTARVGAEVRG